MTSKQLKAWRTKTGYSQSQLARVLCVTTQTISRWERGARDIPSFLHLTLECIEKKGGESEVKGIKKEGEEVNVEGNISEVYIRKLLKRQFKEQEMTDDDITQELIEMKRDHLILRREFVAAKKMLKELQKGKEK